MSDSSDASEHDPYLRLRFNRDPQPHNEEPSRNPPRLPPITSSSLPPLRSFGSRNYRPAATSTASGARSSRYRPGGERPSDRQRLTNIYNQNPYLIGFEELQRSIDADLQLTAGLLDLPSGTSIIPPFAQPATLPSLYTIDTVEESRRVKRRKLDSEKVESNFKGFRYGKEGQAEPGRLNMEIVSCDGGLYSESHQYPPENILKDDSSVYCTKGNRCNIVLRHQGTTVFSLTELIIKAPGSSYSCPVREGMVFVAMKEDELLTRTAQYQIQYSAAQPRPTNTVVYSVRHNDDGTTSTRPQRRIVHNYTFGMDDDDEEYRPAQIPPEFTVPPPPFHITTECTDEESEEEYAPAHRASRRRTPNRIGALPFESDTSDDGEDAWGPMPALDWDTFDDLTNRRYAPRGGRTTRDRPSGADNMTLEEAQEASQIATQEAVRAVGGVLMAPLAHFFIEKHKNKCTIRFDPPVSGRFILLKMWSPTQNDAADRSDNIDIEKVTARGFAGPRYFPNVQLA